MATTRPEQQVSEGGEERLRRRIHLPGTPVVLDPTQVCEHRHSHERPALIVSLIIIALLVFGGIWRQDFALLTGVAAVWLSMTLTGGGSSRSNSSAAPP